jgi:hypothetical protein
MPDLDLIKTLSPLGVGELLAVMIWNSTTLGP